MANLTVSDTWERGSPYERYMGRWSRLLAPAFLSWLGAAPGQRWLDIGCGTGALSAAIVAGCAPAELTGIDPSEGFLATAAQRVLGPVSLRVGNMNALPVPDQSVDVAVSGLVLNFVPQVPAALQEVRRATAAGGTIAAYVWDYAEGMEMLRVFWDAASALDPAAAALDEGTRFGLCHPEALRAAFEQAALAEVETGSLEVPMEFAGFEDYWEPFLGGQGPAPAYVMSLPEAARAALRRELESRLPVRPDGAIHLRARAWAVRGRVPR